MGGEKWRWKRLIGSWESNQTNKVVSWERVGIWDWGGGANPWVGNFYLELTVGARESATCGLHGKPPPGLLSCRDGDSVLPLQRSPLASVKPQVTGG